MVLLIMLHAFITKNQPYDPEKSEAMLSSRITIAPLHKTLLQSIYRASRITRSKIDNNINT
jgi:hypothetical protein